MTCSSFVPDLLCVHTLVMWIYFIAGAVQPIMITCRCNPWECLDSAPPVNSALSSLCEHTPSSSIVAGQPIWKAAGVADKISLHIGPVTDTLADLLAVSPSPSSDADACSALHDPLQCIPLLMGDSRPGP